MRTTLLPLAAITLAAMTVVSPARAEPTCYKLPFGNPNLADGWGSTCCGRTNPHRGVDFPQAKGTKIPAVAKGVVKHKEFNGCLGNVVVIQHPDGMYSGYAHMESASSLKVGDKVDLGDAVGKVGSTGTCTTGPHLHLTMAPGLNGFKSGTTVDPHKYIKDHKTCLPRLDAELVKQEWDAEKDPSGQAQLHLCAGEPMTFSFDLRNTGSENWTDKGKSGDDWGERVSLGSVGDKKDPFLGLTRVSLTETKNSNVYPETDGSNCNDKAKCERTVFDLTGKAPDKPGVYRTEWRLVDEGRAWFGPSMSRTVLVDACPGGQGGGSGEAGAAGSGEAGSGEPGGSDGSSGAGGEGEAGQGAAGSGTSGASPEAGSGGVTSAGGASGTAGAASGTPAGGSSAGGSSAGGAGGKAGGASGKPEGGEQATVDGAPESESESGCSMTPATPGGLLAAGLLALAGLGRRVWRAGRSSR